MTAFRVRASAEHELELELLESAHSPDEVGPSQLLTSIWQNSKFALSEPAANNLACYPGAVISLVQFAPREGTGSDCESQSESMTKARIATRSRQ